MTETSNTAASAAGNSGANGNESFNREKEMAEYEKEKQAVKELLQRRNQLSRNILGTDNRIADMETKYLDSTPVGNILTGFDNYTKGVTATSAQRRKVGAIEQNRVFSRSSISYNPNNVRVLPWRGAILKLLFSLIEFCTDMHDAPFPSSSKPPIRPLVLPPPAAPTPASTSFANKEKNAASDAPTPGSATEKKGAGKKKKAAAAAAATAAEDSETDSREVKKVRTQFGAARK
ncbi:uncharacterized protein PG986_007671 [Apiospora aurea]|uniref:Chromatin modification-related protein EAF6 n=1 Tax=Apiospora aurea TaxID=335848 RepID=A0ABR1QD76_9PEZI